LAVEHKLGGARENYSHPDNSSIDRVLATGKGLPILLSHVAVAVGRRLELPIVGIPVPGRYMFMYDGARGPKEWSGEDIIVDPFDGWKTLTPAEVAEITPWFDPARHQAADTNRASLSRMLSNLVTHAAAVGDPKKAALAQRCQALLDEESPEEFDPQPRPIPPAR
jgi:regulator of sirC expression with transglutaminase-like and TPR domain